MSENFMIIKTKKLSPREVKKKLRDFIDEISEGCSPEIEKMADELKSYGDEFVDALSGNPGGGAQYRNNGEGFRNGGGFSHSSFRGNGGGMQQRGEFRDDVSMRGGGYGPQMRDEIDWNEKERQRQRENMQKLDDLEAEMKRLKMRMNGGGY